MSADRILRVHSDAEDGATRFANSIPLEAVVVDARNSSVPVRTSLIYQRIGAQATSSDRPSLRMAPAASNETKTRKSNCSSYLGYCLNTRHHLCPDLAPETWAGTVEREPRGHTFVNPSSLERIPQSQHTGKLLITEMSKAGKYRGLARVGATFTKARDRRKVAKGGLGLANRGARKG